MPKCLYCKNHVKSNAKYCPRCGKSVIKNTKECPQCEKELALAAKFCSSCGHRFIDSGNTVFKQVRTKAGKVLKCAICMGEIKIDLTACPECLNLFHYNHLVNWIMSPKSESLCPICKIELELIVI